MSDNIIRLTQMPVQYMGYGLRNIQWSHDDVCWFTTYKNIQTRKPVVGAGITIEEALEDAMNAIRILEK